MPKIGRSLPKLLSEEQVIRLIKAPNTKKPLGFRDRVMLEILYATGLRVSELVTLKQGDLNLNQGYIRVMGKGSKERLVPMGSIAKRWLKKYLNGPIVEILGERQSDYLFPTRTSESISRQAFWQIIKKYSNKNIKGVFHCFTGNLKQANQIIDLGFKIGVGGILTFKNSHLKDVISKIDLSSILLETDSPYLSPEPNRGKINEPSNIKYIAEKLSDILSVPLELVSKVTSQNANNLFDLSS